MSNDDTIDLDEGTRLSCAAPSGSFIAIRSGTTPTHRLPVAYFGEATHGDRNVPVSVIGDVDAFESRRGRESTAITEADLVAWLLTNRESLIWWARIGKQATAQTPPAEPPDGWTIDAHTPSVTIVCNRRSGGPITIGLSDSPTMRRLARALDAAAAQRERGETEDTTSGAPGQGRR